MHDLRYARPSFVDWIQAARPKTLTAAIVPFFAGTALAHASGFSIDWGLLLSALASALCIQIGTNFINDAFDFAKGADNQERLGPRRAIQQGLATTRQVYAFGLSFFLAALIFGVPLIVHGGASMAAILLISIISGYLYTGGAFPLAYQGLGDLFVVIFFGWVATIAGYWIQTGAMSLQSLLLGTQIGLLCTLMIAINNLRDIHSDVKACKKTLAVRFGQSFAKCEIALLAGIPYALNIFWLNWGFVLAAILPWITAPLSALLIAKIRKTQPSKAYNHFLALAALLHLSFGLLLIIGLILQ